MITHEYKVLFALVVRTAALAITMPGHKLAVVSCVPMLMLHLLLQTAAFAHCEKGISVYDLEKPESQMGRLRPSPSPTL
jgi:hypothetical protein